MSELVCLKCQTPLEESAEACPACGDRVTGFQRTYAGRLIDGKYQILERLGVGGMGEIFKVRHIHLGEQRVIKIMRANIASDEQALQRFLHEARLATMIKHRNLAMLYDFSTLEDDSYYMVWEFIDGTNIQKWMSTNGPVPPRLAVEIAVQALAGLDALHQMGIIHRDISPENIMLSQDNRGRLLVKVIDFGIAKQLSDGEGGQGLTQTGMFLGKLKYASPEQAGFIREGEQLDARSDLYSFGVVLYEMLAGRAPFVASNPQAYILKHATEKPQQFAQVNPAVSIPASLEAVVLKTLEKDRELRYANIDEFIAALEAIRGEIPPDPKYGLGERMITLSAPTSFTDIPRPTRGARTGAGTLSPTMPARGAKGPAKTEQADAATIIEQKGRPTLTDQKTVFDAQEAQPTISESLAAGAAAPTVAERKLGQDAQPTVLERLAPAPSSRKRNVAPIAAAAGVAALLIGGGIWFATRKSDKPDAVAVVPGTTGTTTATATPSTGVTVTPAGSLAAGEGVLLLTASPYGELRKLENVDTNTAITLSEDQRAVPLRLKLPAGNYRVTLANPLGGEQTMDVRLEPGTAQQRHATFRDFNLDDVVEEILQQ